jgi:transcriptional regulator with XRE-family HTH domain
MLGFLEMMLTRGSAPLSDTTDAFVRSTGAALRGIRKRQGLTQTELAARLQSRGIQGGSSPQTVSAWERGDTPIPLPALPVIAEALHLEPRSLGRHLGLCGPSGARELRIEEGADLLAQLQDEPPETIESILSWWRQSIEIARSNRLGRMN